MTIPNYITLLRILLVPFFYTALVYYKPGHDFGREIALSLFGIACLTDAVDGFISRHWNLKSKLGTFLDPLADKILLVSAFIGLEFSGFELKPPLWILIVIIFREIFLIAGLAAVYFTGVTVKIEPNFLGKLTTFVQMLTVVATLLQLNSVIWLWYGMAGLTSASGIVYILREMRRFNHVKSNHTS